MTLPEPEPSTTPTPTPSHPPFAPPIEPNRTSSRFSTNLVSAAFILAIALGGYVGLTRTSAINTIKNEFKTRTVTTEPCKGSNCVTNTTTTGTTKVTTGTAPAETQTTPQETTTSPGLPGLPPSAKKKLDEISGG